MTRAARSDRDQPRRNEHRVRVQVGSAIARGIPVWRETLAMSDIYSAQPDVPLTYIGYNAVPTAISRRSLGSALKAAEGTVGQSDQSAAQIGGYVRGAVAVIAFY
jgi:hypothetical protein